MERRHGGTPIGVLLTNVSRDVNRAFDAALEAVGGSRSSWLVLMALKRGPLRNQRELAALVGVEGATLSHHLNGMEAAGLVTRRRDPANRRMHLVEITPAGDDAFLRMLGTVVAFDRNLRAGLDDEALAVAEDVLRRMQSNVTAPYSPPTGLVDLVPAPLATADDADTPFADVGLPIANPVLATSSSFDELPDTVADGASQTSSTDADRAAHRDR